MKEVIFYMTGQWGTGGLTLYCWSVAAPTDTVFPTRLVSGDSDASDSEDEPEEGEDQEGSSKHPPPTSAGAGGAGGEGKEKHKPSASPRTFTSS